MFDYNNIFSFQPSSFSYCLIAACKMNVHHRCHKRVPNNCGLNTKDMATVLKEIGISFSPGRKKVSCLPATSVILRGIGY